MYNTNGIFVEMILMIKQNDLAVTENMINHANGVGNGLFNDRFFTIKEAAKRWNIGNLTKKDRR